MSDDLIISALSENAEISILPMVDSIKISMRTTDREVAWADIDGVPTKTTCIEFCEVAVVLNPNNA